MAISKLLVEWYNTNKRELPWRETQNPYIIWVSEIILQQTRVNQGINYFLNFIDQFPDIKSLAESEEVEVLKAWEGLGYYSRARNLRESAIIISKQYSGIFPDTYKDILNLKGIGPYTAGAISSIAFNLPYPAIDGNVKRVISRLYGLKEDSASSVFSKKIETIIMDIIDKREPGKFNQALMDFGSLICLPKNPLCKECFLNDLCYANTNQVVNELPATYRKNNKRDRAFLYFIFKEKDKVVINKRTAQDIWKGMYEFPLIEYSIMPAEEEWVDIMQERFQLKGSDIKGLSFSPFHYHKLSHQNIKAAFIQVEIKELSSITGLHDSRIININDFVTFPFPRLIQKYVQHNFQYNI